MKITINLTLLCLLLSSAFFGNAQSTKQIEKCAQTENDLARLMCYDELFKVSPSGEVKINTQTSLNSKLPSAGASDAMTAESLAALPVQNEQELVAQESQAAPEMSQASAIDRFGAEDLKVQQDKQELNKIESVIEGVSENKRDIRTFSLANGQVWQETESSRLRLNAGTPIFIEKGAFSAHFLGKESANRRVRVKRVK